MIGGWWMVGGGWWVVNSVYCHCDPDGVPIKSGSFV